MTDRTWKAVHPVYGPAECPAGHYLEPGTYTRSWTPCICPPALGNANGHDTWTCRDCERDGVTAVFYWPPCEAR